MGWDAFGLPAENAAIANACRLRMDFDNIAHMKAQFKSLGYGLDWKRDSRHAGPNTTLESMALLTQLEKGIAYQKTGVVNWDPVDKTVLANEQVIDGKGWRTGAIIEKRENSHVLPEITAYAEDLLDELNSMPDWPERVRVMQANWIGRSEGVRLGFPHDLGEGGVLWVFTTPPTPSLGATFCAVRRSIRWLDLAAQDNLKLAAFIEECKRGPALEAELATQEKKGMPTGLQVRHPISGESVPVWSATMC